VTEPVTEKVQDQRERIDRHRCGLADPPDRRNGLLLDHHHDGESNAAPTSEGKTARPIMLTKCVNRFANTVPTQALIAILVFPYKLLILLGERGGTRTRDPMIKSFILRPHGLLVRPILAENIGQLRHPVIGCVTVF
jgi:hypothetical protein